MAVSKEKKQEILQDLISKFTQSKTVVFSGYRGLSVSGMSDLRTKLRETGSECKVAKKTLIQLAAKEINIDSIGDEIMQGPVAVTFSYEDEISGLKALFNFSKTNENLVLLGGIVDGKLVGTEEINQLAKLPGKEELYAKLLGSLNAPISGFVGISSNLISGFVRVLNGYKDTLPAEAVPTEAEAEAAPAVAEEAKIESEVKEDVKADSEMPAEESNATEEVKADESAA